MAALAIALAYMRTVLPDFLGRAGGVGVGAPAISFVTAIRDLFNVITYESNPFLTWQEIINKLGDDNFNWFEKFGYFLVAAPVLAVETGTKVAVSAAVVGVAAPIVRAGPLQRTRKGHAAREPRAGLSDDTEPRVTRIEHHG